MVIGCLCAEDQAEVLNLKSSQIFSEPFFGHAGHFLNFPKYAVALNVLGIPPSPTLAPTIYVQAAPRICEQVPDVDGGGDG